MKPPKYIKESFAITLFDLRHIVENFASFLIMASILIGVIFIVWGGVTYMAAGDDTYRMRSARKNIWSGIIGIFIILAVGLIIVTLASLVKI